MSLDKLRNDIWHWERSNIDDDVLIQRHNLTPNEFDVIEDYAYSCQEAIKAMSRGNFVNTHGLNYDDFRIIESLVERIKRNHKSAVERYVCL